MQTLLATQYNLHFGKPQKMKFIPLAFTHSFAGYSYF